MHAAHHAAHGHFSLHAHAAGHDAGLTRMAFWATLHCLTGCAVGEVLGLVIASAVQREKSTFFVPR